MLFRTFRRCIQDGHPLLGTFVKLAAPNIVEQLGLLGFDFVILDMEHGPLTFAQVEDLVRAGDAVGLPTVVRVPENRHLFIQQALDVGASGVQVPQVESVDGLAAAVQAARYHPAGTRGLSFSHRAARFGSVPREEYLQGANQDVVLVVQVETVKGLAALPDLLAHEGVDVFFLGPADLSQSMGVPGDFGHPRLQERLQAALGAIHGAGRASGSFAADAAEASRLARAGAVYMAVGSEQGFLARGARSELAAWRAGRAASQA